MDVRLLKEMWQCASVRPGNNVYPVQSMTSSSGEPAASNGDRVTAAILAPSTVTVPRKGGPPLASMIDALRKWRRILYPILFGIFIRHFKEKCPFFRKHDGAIRL